MEDLISNAELRSEATRWVSGIDRQLDADKTGSLALTGPFLEPWTLALTIAKLKEAKLRYRELIPYQSARMRCLQVTHFHNMLDWPEPGIQFIRVRPDNLFDPPPRAEMIEQLSPYLGENVSVGDVQKIEGGWAVVVNNADKIPESIPGFTLRYVAEDEIGELPPGTQAGTRSVTAASPRIDAVAAGVLKPSREKIKKHLDSGGVLLNYRPESKAGKELVSGDVVAVRAAGRFRLEDISGYTKKGRVHMTVDILNGG